MNEPSFADRYANLAAGRELPRVIEPALREHRVPPTPTETAVVAGVKLAPAARLTALAAIRDGHRAAARAANDRMHAAREDLEARRRRLRLLEVQAVDPAPHVFAQIEQLAVECEALTAARGAALAEAEAAAAAAAQAHQLLQACLATCAAHGIAVPTLLAMEVPAHA